MSDKIFLEVKDVYKGYKLGRKPVPVLNGVDVSIAKGEWVSLLGASGSGKTTLLDVMGILAKPDDGDVSLDGISYRSLSSRQAVKVRGTKIGFIFQAYHMFPELSILENVTLPAMLVNKRKGAKTKAIELLERVGLGHRITHKPNELSGGEQQRAAIARALINSPELLLADEPTGNLDSETGEGILDIFREMHTSEEGITIVMVTHDTHVAGLADRTVRLKDGIIAET